MSQYWIEPIRRLLWSTPSTDLISRLCSLGFLVTSRNRHVTSCIMGNGRI
jgi:hypothetical protein